MGCRGGGIQLGKFWIPFGDNSVSQDEREGGTLEKVEGIMWSRIHLGILEHYVFFSINNKVE